ncbi:MAG: carboxypeptidase-like regulatory domain-containing protein, partial [Flavobacteriales bacterium]|nr:carboxypeptidase-like regulatory domain-containing protein [Flavobacteriales bacterium]
MHSLRVFCARCFALVLVFGFSSKLYAQADPVVSFAYQEESLEKILREWKRVYELRFAYDPAICHEVFITAYGTGLAPAEALDVLLEQTPLTWKQIGSTYAIYVRPPEENINPTRAVVSWGSKVLDQETREPVAFATVRIAGTTLGTLTDDEGRFFIRDIPSDTSTLVITYVGYQVLRYKLTPEKFDQREPLLISRSTGLMPQAIVYGDQTSLVQSTPEPGLMEVSTLDLNSIGSAGEPDAMKAAQLLPGVDATSE